MTHMCPHAKTLHALISPGGLPNALQILPYVSRWSCHSTTFLRASSAPSHAPHATEHARLPMPSVAEPIRFNHAKCIHHNNHMSTALYLLQGCHVVLVALLNAPEARADCHQHGEGEELRASFPALACACKAQRAHIVGRSYYVLRWAR